MPRSGRPVGADEAKDAVSGRSGDAERLARRRASAGGRGWSASPLRAAPLRRVTATWTGPYGAVEVLECKHELRAHRDMVGETAAARRRCGACLALAARGAATAEAAREDPAARDRRLFARDVGALLVPLGTLLRCADAPTELYDAALELRQLVQPEVGAPTVRYRRFRRSMADDVELGLDKLLRRGGVEASVREAAARLRAACRTLRTGRVAS